MLASIERYLYALIAMLALWVVVVAVTPAVAQAQQAAPTKDTKDTNRNTAERIVVSPGDSLWSISSEWLGPNATPRRVATGVERIYALNQDRIGGDPNLILVGQKLLLPAVSETSRARESGAVAPTRGATKAAEASTRDPGPEKALKASGTPLNNEANPVALPDMPTKQPAPKVDSPTATDTPSLLSSATSAVVGLFPQDDDLLGRKLLGVGIIAFTLLVAGLIASRMPLKRDVGGFEVWGIPRGYVSHYTPVTKPDSGSIGGGEAPAVETVENDLNGAAAGMIAAVQRRRHLVLREQERGSGRSPHTGLATGAHDPQVRRHLRRARTSAPELALTRKPRFRRQGLSPKGGRP